MARDNTALLSTIRAMPVGADLVLKEKSNHAEIAANGKLLADVLLEAARRFSTPLAVPVMDLTLEKRAICSVLGVSQADESTFHFEEPMEAGAVERIVAAFDPMKVLHMRANIEATAEVARVSEAEGVIPVGMSIGPFSLTTKLLKEPITPVYMMGAGFTESDDPMVRLLEQTLELSLGITLKYVESQLDAGAEFIFIAEPAANLVYISPKQLESGSDVFDRVVMKGLSAINALITGRGAKLFFHCCGELTPYIVKAFASLKPAVMSLGCSRDLWSDSSLVDPKTILYGNLPSKRFYSDGEMTTKDVYSKSIEALTKMTGVGHPFILGTECDVLSVPGCEATIMGKVMTMLEAADDFYNEDCSTAMAAV